MAVKLTTTAAITVAAAGTAVTVSAINRAVSSVIIQAEDGNTGNIFVGDSTVDSSNGIILTPGEATEISGDDRRSGLDELILSDVFVDAATNGDAVRVAFFARRSGTNG